MSNTHYSILIFKAIFFISDDEQREIPETYYVVSNNDFIRVAYIMVYSGDKTSISTFATVSDVCHTNASHKRNQKPEKQQQQDCQPDTLNDTSLIQFDFSTQFLFLLIAALLVIGYCFTKKPDYLQ